MKSKQDFEIECEKVIALGERLSQEGIGAYAPPRRLPSSARDVCCLWADWSKSLTEPVVEHISPGWTFTVTEVFRGSRPTTSDLLDKAGLPQSFSTADGPVGRDMMAVAYDALANFRGGLTSLELSSILGLQNPGHENRVWRPGSDRRVNQLLLVFKKRGLIEYRKGSAGVFRWFIKEAK